MLRILARALAFPGHRQERALPASLPRGWPQSCHSLGAAILSCLSLHVPNLDILLSGRISISPSLRSGKAQFY